LNEPQASVKFEALRSYRVIRFHCLDCWSCNYS